MPPAGQTCAAHSLYDIEKPKRIICGFGGLGLRALQLFIFLAQNDRGLRAVDGLKCSREKGLNCESSKCLLGPWCELRASAGERGLLPLRGRRRATTPEARASTGADPRGAGVDERRTPEARARRRHRHCASATGRVHTKGRGDPLKSNSGPSHTATIDEPQPSGSYRFGPKNGRVETPAAPAPQTHR